MSTEILTLRDLSNSKQITIETANQTINASVDDIIRWIAPGAPPHEALKFLLTCKAARMNPFLNEAYLVQMGAKWGTIIAKGGYLKRAEEHPEFDGYEAGVTVQAVDMAQRPPLKYGPLIDIEGEIVPSGHLLVGGWARAWKTNRKRPYYRRLDFSEYNKGTATWKSIPCTMIVKCAVVAVHRDAYGLSDSYDESEMEGHERVAAVVSATVVNPAYTMAVQATQQGDGNRSMSTTGNMALTSQPAPMTVPVATTPPVVVPVAPVVSAPAPRGHGSVAPEVLAPRPGLATEDQVNRIYELFEILGANDATQRDILGRRGVDKPESLLPVDAAELIKKLEGAAAQAKAAAEAATEARLREEEAQRRIDKPEFEGEIDGFIGQLMESSAKNESPKEEYRVPDTTRSGVSVEAA